ncbi:MAG: sugar ABC transporter permease [Clostridia bacterium]|nr:sugar ABC transporter permease [Clostridia bacterium]
MKRASISKIRASKAMRTPQKRWTLSALWEYLKGNWLLYLMVAPGVVALAIFAYGPMFGILLAWKSYSPVLGFFDSPWVGWINFSSALTSYGFWQLVENTVVLGVLKMIFAFPASIILALMFNELTGKVYKRVTQTISYLPYFISWVIINSMVYMFLNTDYGLINNFLLKIGVFESNADFIQWYAEPKYWRGILTFMSAWKSTGWGTIVFLAGISAISPDLYEAAEIDGAGRFKQALYITLPGIASVIGITFCLSISNIIKDDFDMIYCLTGNNSLLHSVADVLGTWNYRMLKGGFSGWGSATAIALLQAIISLFLMWLANLVVKKTGNPSLFGDNL